VKQLLTLGLWSLSAASVLAQGYREPNFEKKQDNLMPTVLRDVGFDQRLGEQVPLDLSFRDEAGQSVRLGDLFHGRPVVLSLVYFQCPMLCKITNAGLASAFSVLTLDVGKDFEAITVSFDPREGPKDAQGRKREALARYRRAGGSEGWHFLTGDKPEIERLTKAVGFRYAWDERTQQFAHPAGALVLTPEGKTTRYMYGVEYAPRDLRLALVEASAGKIGNPVDSVLLYCYHYDPSTGRYGAVVLNIVRLGGALTVAAMVAFLVVMLRRDRLSARATEGRSA
jgi:protein SCO1/2